MALLRAQNLDVVVDGTGMFCDSVSVSQNINAKKINPIGHNQLAYVESVSPNNVTVSLSYIPEIDYEANYSAVRRLKESTNAENHITGTLIQVGGISGIGYLTSYSLSISQFGEGRANAEYAIFGPTSGNLRQFTFETTPSYNISNGSGIIHGISTYISGGGDYSTNVFNANYSFASNFLPLYSLNSQHVKQVCFMGATETTSVSITSFDTVPHHLTGIQGVLSNITGIAVRTISGRSDTDSNWLEFAITGKATSQNVIMSPEQYPLVQLSATAYY